MSGVSYMVPFVAAGGLLIALGFAIGGYKINGAPSVMEHFVWTDATSWAALLFQVGGLAFGFLVPVLAGYIAYGMADRPGLVPGFVGGAIAVAIKAGFLGGLAAGLIAGAVVMAIQKVADPGAAARHHAGGGDPAGLLGARRLPDVPGHRRADRQAPVRADQLAQRALRRQRDHCSAWSWA